MGGPHATRRRRRTPEAATAEIVAAAESLLRDRPYRELTVDEVMRRTGLSRPSFYVYFKDRHALMLRVVDHVREDLMAVANEWYASETADPEVLRRALTGVVGVYGEHAPVARALADASVEDPAVEAAYNGMLQAFVDATADHIHQEQISAGDPTETAKALVWMTERYLYHSSGPVRRVPPGRVLETLAAIWTRALYQTS
jgi:AcrR family transcriptional regulator